MNASSLQARSCLAIALIAAATYLSAQTTTPPASATDSPRAVLVELFTSEGCSSCPPADALLRQINGTRTGAGQLIVGISEHVTYWNSLGWSDPFSSTIYTQRQNAYGQRFSLDSVYTPQMVVNGAEQFVGSDKARLVESIRKQQQQPLPITLRILSATKTGDTLAVSFAASGEPLSTGAEILAVLADDADQSSVLRGENSGRTLAHVAVARSLTHVATLSGPELRGAELRGPNQKTIQLAIPRSFQATAGHHLVLFAQAPGQGRILGIDTTPLQP